MKRPTNERPHIALFGSCNVGKSSFLNALTEQDISIVSPMAGTTTDAVRKVMEFGALGPVVFIDTAGLNDPTPLGKERQRKSYKIMDHCDLALFLFVEEMLSKGEEEVLGELRARDIPLVLIHHKSDQKKLSLFDKKNLQEKWSSPVCEFSSLKPEEEERETIVQSMKAQLSTLSLKQESLFEGLLAPHDVVCLVTPIDSEAPLGRMILPQVQAIRNALDAHALVIVLKESELGLFIEKSQKGPLTPKLVVTDSQCFKKVASLIPAEMPLTSFSILMSRLKGDFFAYKKGVIRLDYLEDNDHLLILESCSHHVTGDDIGRVKIPAWISSYTKKKLYFDVVASFDEPPRPFSDYKLVIQCGGCMLTKKQVLMRLRSAILHNVPVTNYGMVISYCHGIFERATHIFREEKI